MKGKVKGKREEGRRTRGRRKGEVVRVKGKGMR